MPDLHDIFAWIRQFLDSYGYVSVGTLVFLESFGMPLPGETLLISASVVAAKGKLDIVALTGIAFVAATVGDNVGYWIGRRFGRRFVARYGRHIGLTETRIDKVEAVVCKYGPPFVAIARFIEVARQLNGIAAGTSGMRWWRFALFNALGAAIWVGVWSGLAYTLGDHMKSIESWATNIGLAAVGIAVIGGAGAFYWFRRRAGADRATSDGATSGGATE